MQDMYKQMDKELSMGNWISVTEDMPQKDSRYKSLSVEVEVMLKDGTITTAFYADNQDRWYQPGCFYGIPEDNGVVKWRNKA